ncbi:hypothetical protein AYI69_g11579 [Smittium culicis]|uniref:Uncharacterized protein n=1 Tax=Smittium culicis TaxID=133412 RepID=A0A1R1WXD6_9FUNG|nr:hypothetical protein AYI69_g11579 [Smittium culicis]
MKGWLFRRFRAKFFYPPGAPGHPGGHPGLHRCLDEFVPDALHGRRFPDIGNHSDFLVDFYFNGLAPGFAHVKFPPTCCENIRSFHLRYIPLVIHNIAQVGVLVGGVDFLALQGHISSQLPAYSHYPELVGIHSISQVSDSSVMTFSAAIKSANDSANIMSSSTNSSPGMHEMSPGIRTPRMFSNISLD